MNIAIWGVGKYTQMIMEDIVAHTTYHICYIVHNGTNELETMNGIPVIAPEEFYRQTNIDCVVIGISSNNFIEDILYDLKQNQWKKEVFIVQWNAMQFQWQLFEKNIPIHRSVIRYDMNHPGIIFLQTNVVDYCNLNCKACFNLSPFVTKKSELDPMQFESDLRKVTELFPVVKQFYLLGGEPLLNEKLLIKSIEIVRKYLKYTDVRIISNGVLIPKMSKEFWKIVVKYDIIIDISVYYPTFEMKKEIKEVLEREKCLYHFYPEESYIKYFWKRLRQQEQAIGKDDVRMCLDTSCHHLQDGKIYKCSQMKLVQYLDLAENTNYYQNDCIDIYKEKEPWEILEKIYYPVALCKFCEIPSTRQAASAGLDGKKKNTIKWERVCGKAHKEDWVIEKEGK
jgi:sulfatase maturation enzyme AslB (radical SAM superfamily)